MSTVTHSISRVPEWRTSFAIRAAFVLFFWAAAAVSVIAVHSALDSVSVAAAVAIKIAAIVAAAWLYVRLTARNCTVDHALLVGITWVMLDIAAEIAATSHLGKGWFDLIGAPTRPALRDLLLLTWIAAPALFARFPSRARSL